MSKIETNTIAPSTGTTLTLGESGDTIAIGSGVGLSGLAVKKITVNEGITSQYSSLGAGDTTLTDIKVIHTALSTSNKLGFFISIPYSLYTGTYVGITNFKLNDGSSDIATGLYYNYNGGTGVFTAPVTGVYMFGFFGLSYPHTTNVNSIAYYKNDALVNALIQFNGTSNQHELTSGSQLIQLNANDTITLKYYRSGGSGKAYSGQWNMYGYLVG